MTGVSAHALRAWERRYRAVEPQRTPGGARRYSEREVARLRLLRRAVEAGHPIGEVARLSDDEIAERLRAIRGGNGSPGPAATSGLPIEACLEAVRAMRSERLEHALALQLAALGPRRFALELAGPLLARIGDEWERGTLSVAAEHAASSTIRTLLGTTLRRDAALADGPGILFATPAGERHELGALIAAVYALGEGVRSVFLGPDLPADEIAEAARRADVRAVAVSVVCLAPEAAAAELRALRAALPDDVPILVGGRGSEAVASIPGVQSVRHLEDLEQHVSRIPR
jgi:DNA-binding transcriptional MerR regulator/methylmalonyl-CoA mutase cobalamin-binding subunit